MKKKSVLIIVCAVIFLAVAITVTYRQLNPSRVNAPAVLVAPKNETLKNPDYLSFLLTEVAYETELEFSTIKDENLDWQLSNNIAFAIQGKAIESCQPIETVMAEEDQKTPKTLLQEAFAIRGFVTVNKQTEESSGWKKEGLYCVIANPSRIGEKKPVDYPDMSCTSLECAELNSAELTTKGKTYEEIRKLFAKKYAISLNTISLGIQQEDLNHIRGAAAVDKRDGENSESEIFLAAKENNEWVLVFDGNGRINCAEMEKYDFPKEMVQDCV